MKDTYERLQDTYERLRTAAWLARLLGDAARVVFALQTAVVVAAIVNLWRPFFRPPIVGGGALFLVALLIMLLARRLHTKALALRDEARQLRAVVQFEIARNAARFN